MLYVHHDVCLYTRIVASPDPWRSSGDADVTDNYPSHFGEWNLTIFKDTKNHSKLH